MGRIQQEERMMSKKLLNEKPLLPKQKEIAADLLKKEMEANREKRLSNSQAGIVTTIRKAMETSRREMLAGKTKPTTTTQKDLSTRQPVSTDKMKNEGVDMGQADRTLRKNAQPDEKYEFHVVDSNGKVVSRHDNRIDAQRETNKNWSEYSIKKVPMNEAVDPGKMKMSNKKLVTQTAQTPPTKSKPTTSAKSKKAADKFVASAAKKKLVIGKKPHEISNDPELRTRSGK
jgi:hypothetical protein